ncbi:MAG TPA: aminoglycoside 6-adenylyltransferase [Candidatus Limnocylindria bacterium]|nr:aminoglycoside 6-adenylyltransferase [Candidatus Limnocylindria bacterium]
MRADADRWLRSLPRQLGLHRELMLALLREAERDPAIRVLVVGCSLGRGAADELSDVDAMYAVVDTAWRDAVRESEGVVRRVGDVIDMHQQIIEPTNRELPPYQHTFAQYASGVQLDLVVAVARERQAPRPDWIVLYDPDERIVGEAKASAATEEEVRRWMHIALVHLSACAKYLTRGSLWEANAQLDATRAELWRLWAVAERIPDPQYGLTAVLDAPDAPMPENIEATIAGLDRRALRSAAMTCGEILVWTWPRAISTVATADLAMPPLAEWVLKQLRDVAT